MADGSLIFDTKLDTNGVSQGLDSIGKIAGRSLTAVGSAAAEASGKLLALGKEAVNVGKQFEASMSQIAATMGLTVQDIEGNINGAGDNFEMLKNKAEEMGAATCFSAAEAANGLNILAMSGYSAGQSVEMIEDVLHLSAAGAMDMASAAGYVSGAMKGFADETKNSAYYADIMAKGATLANTNVSQLGEAMSGGAAIAKSYGQSAESMTISLLRLAEQGEVGSAASTALAAAMKNLYAPTDQARGLLKQLGVEAFDPATHEARDFNDVVNELSEALSVYSADQRTAYAQTIFGIQGFDAYNKMIVTSKEKQEEWTEALANSAGEAEKQYMTMTDNLTGDVSIIKSAAEGLGNAFYEGISAPLRQLVQDGTGYISELTEALKEGGLEGLAEKMGSVLADMVDELGSYAPEVMEIADKMISSLLTGIEDNSESIFDTAGDIIDVFIRGIDDILPEFAISAIDILNSIAIEILNNSDILIQSAADVVFALADGLSDALPTLVPAAVNAVITIAEGLLENAEEIGNAALEIIIALAQGLVSEGALQRLIQEVPVIISSLVNELLSLSDNIFQVGIGLAAEIIRGLTEFDWAGNMKSVNDKLRNIGAEMHRSLTEGYNHDNLSAENKELIDMFPTKSKDYLEKKRRDIMRESVALQDAWKDYEASEYTNIDDYLAANEGNANAQVLAALRRSEEGMKYSGDTFKLFVDDRISDLTDKTALYTEAIQSGNYYTSDKDMYKNAGMSYAKTAEYNSKQHQTAAKSVKESNVQITESAEEAAEGMENAAETAEKSTERISKSTQKLLSPEESNFNEFKKAWEDIQSLENAGTEHGGISEEEAYNRKINLLKKYHIEYSAETQRFYNEIWAYESKKADEEKKAQEKAEKKKQDDEKAAEEELKKRRESEWQAIETYNKLGVYSDKQAQEERLKWIRKYCPVYSEEWDKYYNEVYNYQKEEQQKQTDSEKAALKERADNVKNSLAAIANEYKTKYNEIQSDISNYKSKLMSIGETFSITDKDDGKGGTVRNIDVNTISKRLAQMKNFHKNMLKLRDMGASKALISEIMNTGADNAAVIAEKFVKSGNFEDFNSLYKELEKEAQAMAEEFYSPELETLNKDTQAKILGEYEKLPEDMREIGKSAMDELLNGMADTDLTEQISAVADNISGAFKTAIENIGGDYSFGKFLLDNVIKTGLPDLISAAKSFSIGDILGYIPKIAGNTGTVLSTPFSGFSLFSQPQKAKDDTISIDAKIYTTVELDGKAVGQSVTDYQHTEARKGDGY